MTRLLIATSNPHKVKEIQQILGTGEFEVFGLERFPDVAMPDETGATFSENARLKAVPTAQHTGEITLADDSGICVDALGGEPGIHSNRFLGDDTTPEERNTAILRMLGSRPDEERRARFVCAVCIALPNGDTLDALETCEGVITTAPAGDGGFGYDPIFFVPSLGKTLAEVPGRVKNTLSHRGKATRAAAKKLVDHLRRQSV